MQDFYFLNEVSEMTGIGESTLRRKVREGEISGTQMKKGRRPAWAISHATLQTLTSESILNEYDSLVDQWDTEQENGIQTGKPIGESARYNNRIGLRNYWKFLNLQPNLQELNAENLGVCFASIGVDYERKECHYATKHQTYKGVCSFLRFLIRRGLKLSPDLDAIKSKFPKRVFPPRKTVLQEDALKLFLEANQLHVKGRSDFDIQLTQTLIMIFAYAGLRRTEALNLKLEHIDLPNDRIYVIDGKGHKNRVVGLTTELKEQLLRWLKSYRPKSKNGNLLLQASGKPLSQEIINERILKLSRRAGLDITPHGLRRTFATLMENKGMPWSLIQLALGHNDIKTTQSYVMSDDRKMVEWMKNLGNKGTEHVSKMPNPQSKLLDFLCDE